MNKKELTAHVQRVMGPGATRRAAVAAVDAVLSSIAQLVYRGPVTISGFGTFCRRRHAASTGYDITRGCMQARQAYSTLEFRAARELREETDKHRAPH